MPSLVKKIVLELLSLFLAYSLLFIFFIYNILWYISLKVKCTGDLDIMILLKNIDKS